MRDGQVTHAGMLLFARREVLAQRCPQAQFHYVLHDGETSVARNDIDRLPLLEAVERMEQIFTGPLNPEKEIELGLFKLRIPQFPVEGVREAVLNALTHRDYLNPGEILVRHSTKELVVTSPGGFIAGITPENILRHEAVPRNRTLANALVKLRLVESSGIGRRRIFRSALVFGKRRPEYATDGHSVTLRMFNREAHDALSEEFKRSDDDGRGNAIQALGGRSRAGRDQSPAAAVQGVLAGTATGNEAVDLAGCLHGRSVPVSSGFRTRQELTARGSAA
jgi:ATP-dependent DNA helicase RecG